MKDIEQIVFEQFEQVRETGLVNMFDRQGVMEVANTFDFYELVGWVDSGGRHGYASLLSQYAEAKERYVLSVAGKSRQ